MILGVLACSVVRLDAQQQIVFLQLNKHDSLARAIEGKKFSGNELKYHQMIWQIKGIRQAAIELNKKGIIGFTMTDEWPSPDSFYYIISFYEMAVSNKTMERYSRLRTYRVNKRMRIEVYNIEDDDWKALE